jgi:N-acyl-D-aspartate/D-glutamate deacylase
LASSLRADVNLIDFDRLQLHKPQIVHGMPADGSRFVPALRRIARYWAITAP